MARNHHGECGRIGSGMACASRMAWFYVEGRLSNRVRRKVRGAARYFCRGSCNAGMEGHRPAWRRPMRTSTAQFVLDMAADHALEVGVAFEPEGAGAADVPGARPALHDAFHRRIRRE